MKIKKKTFVKRWIKTLPTFAMNPTIIFAH